MRIRAGFVSNSSSCAFIIRNKYKSFLPMEKYIRDYIVFPYKYPEDKQEEALNIILRDVKESFESRTRPVTDEEESYLSYLEDEVGQLINVDGDMRNFYKEFSITPTLYMDFLLILYKMWDTLLTGRLFGPFGIKFIVWKVGKQYEIANRLAKEIVKRIDPEETFILHYSDEYGGIISDLHSGMFFTKMNGVIVSHH